MPHATLTVMTRNLYLGADITRPLAAVSAAAPEAVVDALAHATHRLRDTLRRTRFDVRGRLLAAELAATRPDVVGLQEAAVWRTGPLGPAHIGVPDAVDVDHDLLAELLDHARSTGVPYDTAAVLEGADVESPSYSGTLAAPGPDPVDLRLTMRDAIAIRRGAPLTITGAGGARFQAQLEVDVAGRATSFGHGHTWVDLVVDGSAGRLVSTHLDSESPDVARRQAAELVAATASLPGWVVIVGDLNSDPADRARAGAHRELTTAGGFVDAAAAAGHPEPTFGFGELLDDDSADGFDQRIDHVLVRGPQGGAPPTVLAVTRTGVGPGDRDPETGLWASDHAGLVVALDVSGAR